jgi:uncharacterized membrane protein SpoIIM required for sporulation
LASIVDTLKIIAGKRWPLIAALFVVELAIIAVVSNLAFSPSEFKAYEDQYNSLAPVLNASAPSQVGAIFTNNLKVATIELVPAFGLLLLGLSLYETARIVEAIGAIKGVPVALALANLFILPSTWLELPAYAIAAAESVYLVYAIYLGFKKGSRYFVRELRFLLVTLLLIVGVLIVAALFEVSEIQIATASPDGAFYALLTWLPFGAVFAGVLVFWRRARREAPALEAREEAGDASQSPEDQGRPRTEGEEDAAGGPAPSPSSDGRGATP